VADQVYESMVEYGKVVTGQFGISGMTDTARKETATLLTAADRPATFEQLIGKEGLFRKNMAQRNQEYENSYNFFAKQIGVKTTQPAMGSSAETEANQYMSGK